MKKNDFLIVSPIIKEKRILFIGDFNWISNKDALNWLLEDIWPYLQRQNDIRKQNFKLWIVGRHIPNKVKKLKDKSIIFTQDIENAKDAFYKSFVLLAPLRVKGGTNLKILESMACGTPVITTDLGNQGIDAKPDKEILIANTKEEMLNKLLLLSPSQKSVMVKIK